MKWDTKLFNALFNRIICILFDLEKLIKERTT